MEIEFIDEKKKHVYKWKWMQIKLKKIHNENLSNGIDTHCLSFLINFNDLYTGNTTLKSYIHVLYIIDKHVLTLYCKDFTDVGNYGVITNKLSHAQIELIDTRYTPEHDKIINDLFTTLYKKLKKPSRCKKCFTECIKTKCINCMAKKSLTMFYKDKVGKFEQEKCSICFLKFKPTQNLACIKCGHYFHLECITKCKRKYKFESTPCPLCKTEFKNIMCGIDCFYYKLDFNLYDTDEYEDVITLLDDEY